MSAEKITIDDFSANMTVSLEWPSSVSCRGMSRGTLAKPRVEEKSPQFIASAKDKEIIRRVLQNRRRINQRQSYFITR
jgi:hypothetical protein